MKMNAIKAAPAASAIALKNEKSAKAKRILIGTDVHLRGYQAARKVDNGVIGVVENFRSQEALLLYVEKRCERAEQVVVVYEAVKKAAVRRKSFRRDWSALEQAFHAKRTSMV